MNRSSFREAWERISAIGTKDIVDFGEHSAARMTNQLATLFAATCLLYGGILAGLGDNSVALVSLGLSMAYAALLAINWWGYHVATSFALLLGFNCGVSLYANVLGLDTGTHLALYAAIGLPTLIFPIRRYGLIIGGASITIALRLALDVWQAPIIHRVALSPSATQIIKTTSIVVSLLLVLCVVAFLRRENDRRTSELRTTVSFLEQEVSRRIDIEHEAREAQVLAQAGARAKGAFLATMSHEIRTPLHAVLGMAQVLERSPLSPEQLRMVNTINDSGTLLLHVLNDVLDLSRLESGNVHLEYQLFDVPHLLTGVVDLQRASAGRKGLEITTEMGDVTTWVGDPNRVKQVLHNLVANAIKFTSEGSVHVRAKQLPEAQQICFEVHDTGAGVQSDDIEELFEPFVQQDASTSRKFGGSGLGLAICKRLVVAMKGEIGANSVETGGTRFWFTIGLPPPRSADHLRHTSSSSIPAVMQPSTWPEPIENDAPVLVAEDDETSRYLARAMLSKLGVDAVLVRNGQEATAAAKEGQFMLVLMDCNMPVMDGFTATRAIRQQEETGQRVPIIALTASTSEAVQRDCIEAGMDGHLPKPVTLKELNNVILEWRTKSAGIPPSSREPKQLVTAPDDRPVGTQRSCARDQALTLDLDRVAALSKLMQPDGTAVLELVVDMFVDDGPERLKTLQEAVSSGDVGALERLAHSLKGTAGNLGATRLAELSAELESAAQAGAETDHAAQLVAIRTEMNRVTKALEELRPAR